MPIPDYVNLPEISYDWMIVAYFFLGGLSAGTFIFAVATTHWKSELGELGRLPAFLAPLILMTGLLILLLDLGQPFRAWRLFLSFNPRSALSWGVWFLNIFLAIGVLHALALFTGKTEAARKLGNVGIPFAVLVAGYTGILLNQAHGRPLWHSALLPLLFLNGGVISGTALGLIASLGKGGAAQLTLIGRVLAFLLIVELGMLTVEMLFMLNGSEKDVIVACSLLTGAYAPLFLGVEVILGTLFPAALLLCMRGGARVPYTAAAALALLGVLTMRYVVVVGAQEIIG